MANTATNTSNSFLGISRFVFSPSVSFAREKKSATDKISIKIPSPFGITSASMGA